jgi:transketolase
MNKILQPIAMRDAFLKRIWQSMSNNEKLFFVTADFGSPVLDKIRADFPERFLNVGIAEQNLINISTGLALTGFTVFAYAIAPFITMRCYEQIRVNLSLLSLVRPLNINLIGVGAGCSYVVSGPTHQCYEDISIMRAIQNIEVLSPADHVVAESLFEHCSNTVKPKYLRFDAQVLPVIYNNITPNMSTGFQVHKSAYKKKNSIVIIATGYMLHTALKIAKLLEQQYGLSISVIDLFNITNVDFTKLKKEITEYCGVVSMEEGFSGCGGMDSMLLDFIARNNLPIKFLNIGIEGGYHFELGARNELHEKFGIGPVVALNKIRAFIEHLEYLKE